MIYFFTAFFVFILFLVFQRDKRTSVNYLTGTVFSYALAIIFMILYLSRDVRYYNIIEEYFLLPKAMWKTFMFFPISKTLIIRLMNAFSLLTILLGCMFSLNYARQTQNFTEKNIRRVLFLLIFAEFLLYDPAIEKLCYLFFYPNILNLSQYNTLLDAVHTITMLLNNGLILLSILNLLRINRQMHFFPYLKYCFYGEVASYILIMISYLAIFGQLPSHMIRFSRVSGYVSYTSLNLYDSPVLYSIFPYYLFLSAVLMFASTLALVNINQKINQKDFTMSGQIDAVNTSSRAFCHYMKNELLALEAEAQLLEVSEELQPEIDHMVERCENLYNRLDKLHRSTRPAQLVMENTNLEQLIHQMLERMSLELKDCQVDVRTSGQIQSALVDPNYFEQALHNIVTNSLDAMAELPPEKRSLHFTLRSMDNWIALSITDTGKGIPADQISHIFEPFFTSQPIARHWGVGMTMTYQIVKAHNGKITVESKEGKGTTFRILLPNLKKMLP